MKIDYTFKYRSKVYQNLCVVLQNLLVSLFTLPIFPLLNCIVVEFDSYFVDDNLFLFMIIGVLSTFIITMCKYYFGKKGVKFDKNELVINYCCINIGIHSYCKIIKYCDIKNAEIGTENLNNRILEVEGGDYTDYAVINYKNNKQLCIPVENLDLFISELNAKLEKRQ